MNTTLDKLAGNMTAEEFVTIASVMTLSIMVGIWLVPLVAKKMQKGLVSFESKDKRWADILQSSLFIGMISAFVGYVFSDVYRLWSSENGVFITEVEDKVTGITEQVKYTSTSGLVPVGVMAVSMISMAICGILIKKLGWKWLNDYALPICMVIGMASAIPLKALLGGQI